MFFGVWRGPRALQEASKRLSAGFRVEDAIRIRFWTHFWLQKESPGPQKSLKFIELWLKTKVSPFSAWINFGPHFGTLLGSILGASWTPRWLKPVLGIVLGRPRAAQEDLRSTPEASKSAPRALQEACRRPPGCQDNSKSSPRGPRIDFGSILEPFGNRFPSQFGAI